MSLKDQDPMPFGEHKGKPMEKVPASYLIWFWNENVISYKKKDLSNARALLVMDYINDFGYDNLVRQRNQKPQVVRYRED